MSDFSSFETTLRRAVVLGFALLLLTLFGTVRADSDAPAIQQKPEHEQEKVIVIEADASALTDGQSAKTLIIEAHLDDDVDSNRPQPMRKKRIRILKSSDEIDHPEVQALIEKLSQGADLETIHEDIELITGDDLGEALELSDLDTHVFVGRPGPGMSGRLPPMGPHAIAEGVFQLPKGGAPMRWHASKPHQAPLSKAAADCILDRIAKIETEAGAMLLRDACSAAHPESKDT